MNTETIRDLNDAFRTQFSADGRVVITQGIAALGTKAVHGVVRAVKAYDAFDADNDPYGEHDFGAFDHGEDRIFWKIDTYDRDLSYGSENPADPAMTTRVLTIMHSDEY